MLQMEITRLHCCSMVTTDDRQRIDLHYTCSHAAHLFLDVIREGQVLIHAHPLAVDSGEAMTTLLLPRQPESFPAVWQIKDRSGAVLTTLEALWTTPREWTLYTMISSHTDIGLHNSQYIQRYNSSVFLEDAMRLCDETRDRPPEDRYRYTVEGSWFWNNYCADRGTESARQTVENYVQSGHIGVCGGIAGNTMQLFGLEELCRSSYERRRLRENWDVQTETMAMIDMNGLPMSMIGPYAQAGYKNLIFAPNQWNPHRSTVWKLEANKERYWNGPNVRGGGSRIDFRYDSALPMVFYWEDAHRNRLLVWGSSQYHCGGFPFGMLPFEPFTADSLAIMEESMAQQLTRMEKRYPYDLWLIPCYADDEKPNPHLTDGIQMWNRKWKWPRVRTLGDPDEPFRLLREHFDAQIPVLHGDIAGGWYQMSAAAPELLSDKFQADRTLPNAEKWATVAALLDPAYRYPQINFRRAWDALLWNDEHSYGCSGYQGRRVYETWMQHRDWIEKAAQTAREETDRALQSVCAQIPAEEPTLAIFNPMGQTRQERVEWNGCYARISVPPMGYKTVPISQLHPCPAQESIVSAPPAVENRWYRLRFAPDGSIRSIFDKELNRELLDSACPHGANTILYTQDNHQSYCPGGTADFRITTMPEKLTVTARSHHPALNCALEQTVTLYETEKRIDLDNRFTGVEDMINRDRQKRYLYIAFPFRVENPRRLCHLNGCMAEYARTVTGHATDVYMAVNEWCCAENETFGAALIMQDTQLVEFDRIHPDKTDFGDAGEGSAIYVYAANDWMQHHCPGGSHLNYRFRYTITSYPGTSHRQTVPVLAERITNPLQLRSIEKQAGTLPPCLSFLTSHTDARLLCVKRAEDGRGLIARLYGTQHCAGFDSFWGYLPARKSAIDETDTTAIPDCEFQTYRLAEDTLCLERQPESPATASLTIGAAYTGLITQPRAACGEHDGHLYLLWGAVRDADFSHYNLYRSLTPDFTPDEASLIAQVPPEEFVVGRYEDKGLLSHTRYFYRVCAVNKNGICGPMSPEFSAWTRQQPPSV